MGLSLQDLLINTQRTLPLASDMAQRGHLAQLKLFLGPAFRGLILQNSQGAVHTNIQARHNVNLDLTYTRDHPLMKKLYEAANSSQWNANLDIDWSRQFDPLDTVNHIIPDSMCPGVVLPQWKKLSAGEKAEHRLALLSWMLSQILHGEQGALFGAAQTVQAIPWLDGKLLGASQIADEARHVEVFHRYLNEKLGKFYNINENLFVLTETIISDPRWDVKCLGMQIMIEGFALGAFTMIRNVVAEPTLKHMLKLIMIDEARHVNYGTLALEKFYKTELNERELQEREDLAFEISLLLQRRFLAHEIYEEFWSTHFTYNSWNKFVGQSQLMTMFRKSMFRLIIPNLKRIGLLSDRIKPRYAALGVLEFESAPTVYEMSQEELLNNR